jgi:hypothetical protein
VEVRRAVQGLAEALRRGAGGIRWLYRLLKEHGRAVEADLRRYYQVRLRDLGTDRLSYREAISYIVYLPPDSALHRTLGDGWDPVLHRLTDLGDLLLIANWQRGADKSTPQPQLLPRPGARPEAQAAEPVKPRMRQLTADEFDAYFNSD